MRSCIFHSVFFVLLTALSIGQTWPDSPVFRDYRPDGDGAKRQRAYARQVGIFLLERDASAGDPLAQHELGIRYLTGKGVAADTLKSAEWLKRAADQEFTPALYNYALLLANGWGVEWNPFEAYSFFLRAAEQGMPEAQLVVGIFHTDDLVLRQDWDAAYRWMSLAADNGLEAARRAAEEIERRGHVKKTHATAGATSDQSVPEPPSSAVRQDSIFHTDSSSILQESLSSTDISRKAEEEWSPLLLDFTPDTTRPGLGTLRLLHDFIASTELSPADSAAVGTLTGTPPPDSLGLKLLTSQATSCNPEALVLLGRLYEEGVHLPRDYGAAAVCYLRASWHESPLALAALVRLLSTSHTADAFLQEAYAGNAKAQYVVAELHALEFERRLSQQQAFEMLKRAIDAGSIEALVQMGLWYAGGRVVERDMATAVVLWSQAASLHNEEARIRLAASSVLGETTPLAISSALPILEHAARQGSLLAATAMARSYEAGIGRSPNKGIAARMYREAAIRGSRSAYEALRRMHEALRP